MKGEILRRMSMEISKDQVEVNDPVETVNENGTSEDKDDYLVKTIGAIGLWHVVVSATVTLTRVIAIWNIMSILFLAPANEFVCVKFSNNVTTEVMNSTCYDDCLKYKLSSVIGKSIIEEFGLICQSAQLVSVTQTILMLGILVGMFLFGWISDRFGRRMAMLQSTLLNAIFMIALSFSPTYAIFTSIRFVIGVATGGCMLVCVVHVMEITGKQYRETAVACTLIPDSLAQASLAVFAYFTSNWQHYTLSYGVVTCFIFVLILFVPESPRWLASRGRLDEAIQVITRAANRNKLNTSHIKTEITSVVEDLKSKNSEIVQTPYLDFFKRKDLFILTFTVFIVWFSLGLCHYGVYQYVPSIVVDPYLSVAILGFIQILFCPIAIIFNQRFGRKICVIGLTITVATLMLVLIFVSKDHFPGTLLGVLALISSNIYFSIFYIYVSELYPTPLRNMSLAFSSGGAMIGAMIAPSVNNLAPTWLPSLIFCVVALIAGLCCFTIPETKDQNLRDTIGK